MPHTFFPACASRKKMCGTVFSLGPMMSHSMMPQRVGTWTERRYRRKDSLCFWAVVRTST